MYGFQKIIKGLGNNLSENFVPVIPLRPSSVTDESIDGVDPGNGTSPELLLKSEGKRTCNWEFLHILIFTACSVFPNFIVSNHGKIAGTLIR
jgi:hypothetical protein